MYLKMLELQGFKSFPDKTTLHFNKVMTAVVGPNGSGKSNISDAVRWVLGEQSTKNLRGSKMEDVIFSGTDTRRAVGFAEVSLTLDNSDHVLGNDRNEVKVTRRYYRSGESEYAINGEQVRLKDINELFMDTGLGRDGYSLISQGKVETLISGKSEERRDMLEEAAGISHYRYRRTDALRRLDQAEENLLRLRDILTELESRVGPLKTQSEKARKFLDFSAEKKDLEIGLWLYTIEKTKSDLREQEKDLAIATAQHEELNQSLEKIAAAIEKAALDAQQKTLQIDEVRRSASSLEEQAAQLDSSVAVHENTILHNRETIERIERDKQNENATDAEIAQQIAKTQEAIAELTSFAEEKNREFDALTGELQSIVGRNSDAADRFAALSGEASALTVAIADSRVKTSTAASSVGEIESRLAALEKAAAERSEVQKSLQDEKEKAEKALCDEEEHIESLTNSLKGIGLLSAKRTEKLNQMKAQESELADKLRQKQSREGMLSDLEKNMEGYQGSVKAVMREASHGTLSGIHAPVSQLISVENRYALAVETALGAQLQHIVTDTEKDAKAAISFLKESRAGRATFLPLTSIRGRSLDEKGLTQNAGYIGIASDLITFDPKYREIVLSLLGRTAVAEDLDAAIPIAKKYGFRFKIVTLDGQVVNAGGSMTGGARLANAGILSRAGEIEKLKIEAQELKEKLGAFSVEVRRQQESCAAAFAEEEGCRAELTSANENKVRLLGALELRKSQLSAVEKTGKSDETEKEQLSLRRSEILAGAKTAEKEWAERRQRLEEAERVLAELTDDRNSLQKQREELSEKASQLRLAAATAEKEKEAKAEALARLSDRSVSHRDRLASLEAEKAEVLKRNADLEAEIAALKEEAAKLRAEQGFGHETVERLIKEREQFEKQSADLRAEERIKSEEREKVSGEEARLTERRDTMNSAFEEAAAKLFDEYELTRAEAEKIAPELNDIPAAKKRLNELKNKIRALGSVNVGAVEEYKEVSERYEFMKKQLGDIETSKAELLKLISELTEKMGSQFCERFGEISVRFGETFAELFGGGKAQLLLSDPSLPLESDIEIKVQPPGKNVQNLSLLSGGEKGLSAIALLFAILKVNPCPFCIFDEVEAALDDVNVARYAAFVRRMVAGTQFILITHRRGTMEAADMLYGVTMQEKGVSKLLELKTAEMAKDLGLE